MCDCPLPTTTTTTNPQTADKLVFGLDWDDSQEDLDHVRLQSDLRQENEVTEFKKKSFLHNL
jgi:hypothetical protein